jgi:MOSC domain-containing protein YiiM
MQKENGRVISVNVGLARTVIWRGQSITTGIFKVPVDGAVAVGHDILQGDQQADLAVHGGADKAVYAYGAEDYAWWATQLGRELPPGTFGENLTTQGIAVSEALIGERWQVGTAVLEVAQPRFPCYKLGMKMDDPDFVRAFAQGRRPGAYLRVVRPGAIARGDDAAVIARPDHGVTVRDVAEIREFDRRRAAELIDLPGLPSGLRAWAEKAQLQKVESRK